MCCSRTVLENLRFGNQALTPEQIRARLKAWSFLETVEEFPDGCETVCNGGMSMGQLQLVAVLQVLCKNAPLVLLDEPTGYMNAVYIDKLLYALKHHFRHTTIVFVTHDPRFEQLATAKLNLSHKTYTLTRAK